MAWLTAEEALQVLGTKAQTLYANVSRGRVQSRPHPDDPRKSLYRKEDVDRLATRHVGRRSSEKIAAGAIEWGEPVLPSKVSQILDGCLYYRGRDALQFSEAATLEEAAELLWMGPLREPYPFASKASGQKAEPLEAALLALAHRAVSDLPSYGRSTSAMRKEAESVFHSLCGAMIDIPADDPAPVHQRLATLWERPDAADLIRMALVLLADHELNASTFATRVAISTGASLSAALLAGLATLTGPLHGGSAATLTPLVELAAKRGPEEAIGEWLAQGRSLPSFGHRLYPDGDCRAAVLLRHFEPPPAFRELREAAERIIGEKPNIDFALAALAAKHRLPRAAPLVIFALARSVGWIAHALEQLSTGSLIRPRARY